MTARARFALIDFALSCALAAAIAVVLAITL